MSTVEEIEEAISKLKPKEIVAIADWLAEFREEVWDRQIVADAKAGRLDSIIKEAKVQYRAGRNFPRN